MATLEQIGELFDSKTQNLTITIKNDIAEVAKKFDEKLDKAMTQLRGEFMEELQKMKQELQKEFGVDSDVGPEVSANKKRGLGMMQSKSFGPAQPRNQKEMLMEAQVKMCGFGENLTREERIKIANDVNKQLLDGDHPIVTIPKSITAFRPFGREAVYQFETKALADGFLNEVNKQGRTIPKFKERQLFFVPTRIGDDFEKEKAVMKAVKALRIVLEIDPSDKDSIKGDRGRGSIWYNNSEVFKVFMEQGKPILKADTAECKRAGIVVDAVKGKFNSLLTEAATRFS